MSPLRVEAGRYGGKPDREERTNSPLLLLGMSERGSRRALLLVGLELDM